MDCLKHIVGSGTDPGGGGSCRGWQPLRNGNWHPCAEGAGALIFISIRRVSQFGVYFASKALYGRLAVSEGALLIKKAPFSPTKSPF